MIRLFVSAASRAIGAGFDGVQIRMAHFYFHSRFVSPAHNHRTDQYGGSPQRRARIVVEIIEGIRTLSDQLHISLKANSADYVKGGLDETEALEICTYLATKGR